MVILGNDWERVQAAACADWDRWRLGSHFGGGGSDRLPARTAAAPEPVRVLDPDACYRLVVALTAVQDAQSTVTSKQTWGAAGMLWASQLGHLARDIRVMMARDQLLELDRGNYTVSYGVTDSGGLQVCGH